MITLQHIQCKIKSLKTLLVNYHHNCINVKMQITLTEGPIFGENKYKTAFFHMSDFLYEFSYLIHCKHFVDVFLPVIVIVTTRNIIFLVSMKKAKLQK